MLYKHRYTHKEQLQAYIFALIDLYINLVFKIQLREDYKPNPAAHLFSTASYQ